MTKENRLYGPDIDSLTSLFEAGMDRKLPEFKQTNFQGTVINMGAGHKHIFGALDLDWPEWDAENDRMPFDTDSVNAIYAFHFLEHINNVVGVLKECQRVLVDGGVLNIVVPYYTSQLFAQDLDHKHHQFCEQTWKTLFNNPYYDKDKLGWKFDIGINMIMGIKEENTVLVTQLIRRR